MCIPKNPSPSDRVPVEWHDSSWYPAIRGQEQPSHPERMAKMLVPRLVLPQTVRLKKNSMKTNLPRYRRGFTLVELLTVIAIIGILAAMLLPVLSAVKQKALVARAKTEESGIVTAIVTYDTDYGRYPQSPGEKAVTTANGKDCTEGLSASFPPATGTWSTYTPNYPTDDNSNIVAILMDLQTFPSGVQTVNYGHVLNPKQVKYLNVNKFTTDPTVGGIDTNGIYRDPWGNPYVITMNTSYSLDGSGAAQGQGTSDMLYSLQVVSQVSLGNAAGYNGLFNPSSTGPNSNDYLSHNKVMVWSAGPDKKYDFGPATGPSAGYNKDNVVSWQ